MSVVMVCLCIVILTILVARSWNDVSSVACSDIIACYKINSNLIYLTDVITRPLSFSAVTLGI